MRGNVLFFSTNSLNATFSSEIEKLGYGVTVFHNEKIIYPEVKNFSFIDKLKNIYYRIIKKDTSFPHKKQKKFFNNWVINRLESIIKEGERYEAIIFFRGDLYEREVLLKCKRLSHRMVSFQADGISVSQRILEYRDIFDDVFCFDPDDAIKYNFKFLTNCILFTDVKEKTTERDVFYLGTSTYEREESVMKLENLFVKNNISFKAILNINKYKEEKTVNSIEHTYRFFDYWKVLEYEKKSKCILDLVHTNHNGLSSRFFEAMEMQKKIITNNVEVKKYDFYNKNNIFIIGLDDEKTLFYFINSPYEKLDEDMILKYRLENWLNIVLDTENKIEIENPLDDEKI